LPSIPQVHNNPSLHALTDIMTTTFMLCVPGPWANRTELLTTIVQHTRGEFMFAGLILAQPARKRHVQLELTPPYSEMREAFEIAGHGKISPETLAAVGAHQTVAYLHFENDFISEREKVIDFCALMRDVGGIALKVESAGVAHEWAGWFDMVSSENSFDWYRALVTLIGDDEYYYSCGMHQFALADVEVSREVPLAEAADLMNRFNYWRISEAPVFESGHTFSLAPDSPRYRMLQVEDGRHEPDDLFHNPQGLWRLEVV
jgi:hypothetical protein